MDENQDDIEINWAPSLNPKRPFLIERDVQKLQKNQLVTKILSKQVFKGKLEEILKNRISGSPKSRQKQEAILKLQQRVIPAPPEMSHHQPMLPLSSPAVRVRPIDDLKGIAGDVYSKHETIARCKLASLYRLVERFGWSQLIYNHITLSLPGDIEYYLVNAFGLHYSEVTASNLVKVNADGIAADPGSTQLGIHRESFALHSTIHLARPDIRCIIHINAIAGAAVSAMRCGLMQLCQESMAIGSVSYHKCGGMMTNESERRQLVTDLGPVNKVMLLHNHGILAMGQTVEEAFGICHNVMRACEIQIQALSAGRDFALVIREDIARELTQKRSYQNYELEFEAMMRLLDHLGYDTGYPYKTQNLLHPSTAADHCDERNGPLKEKGKDKELDVLFSKIRQEIKRIREERKREQHDYYKRNFPSQQATSMYTTGLNHDQSSKPLRIGSQINKEMGQHDTEDDCHQSHSKPSTTNEWSFLENRLANSSPTGFRKTAKASHQHAPSPLSNSQPIMPQFVPSALPSSNQPLAPSFQSTGQFVSSTLEQVPSLHSTLPLSFTPANRPALPLHHGTVPVPVTSHFISEASLPLTRPLNSEPFPPLHPPPSLPPTSLYFPQSFSATVSSASLPQSSSKPFSFLPSSNATTSMPSSFPLASKTKYSPPIFRHSKVPTPFDSDSKSKQHHLTERVQFDPHIRYVSAQSADDETSSPSETQVSSRVHNETTGSTRKISLSSSSDSTVSPVHSPSSRGIDGRLEKAKAKAKDIARSTGQSAERLTSHKKKRQLQQGTHSNSSSTPSLSSGSSTNVLNDKSALTSGDIDVNDDHHNDDVTKRLKGLDRVIHTAEQVAQSTGESVEKLSKKI